MKFHVYIEDQPTEINVNEGDFTYTSGGHSIKLVYEDVIGLEKSEDGDKSYNLYYIQESTENKLTKEKITFTTDSNDFDELQKNITSKIWTVTERPKKVAVFVNSVGGDRQGKQLCEDIVVPVLSLAGIETDVIVSQSASHATEFTETYDFKQVDGIVIMGGDGTVSDICNGLMIETQKKAGVDLNDPNGAIKTTELPVAVIPTGTWNGIVNVMHGCKDVLTSTLHVVKGNKCKGSVLGSYSGGELVGYAAFCTGYGIQTEICKGIIKFRWMGYMRSIIALLWYAFIRPYRDIHVEIAYEYLERSQPHDLSEKEKKCLKVTQKKKIINLLAFTYNFEFENIPGEQQVQKDEFDLIDYKMCSRSFLIEHYKRFGQILTKEYRDEAKEFINYNKIVAFRLRALEENVISTDELRHLYNIDGEMRKLKTSDVYVKYVKS